MRVPTLRCIVGSNPTGSMHFFLKGTDVFGLKGGKKDLSGGSEKGDMGESE